MKKPSDYPEQINRNPSRGLKLLLLKFGIKSARSLPGITFIIANMVIHKPGAYTKVTNVSE